MPVILACGRWGHEDREFEANISYKRLSPTPSSPKRKDRSGKRRLRKQKDAGPV